MKRLAARAFIAASILIAMPAAAQQLVSGVRIPETLRVGDRTLALSSCGVRDTLWIDHSVAALYLPAESPLSVRDPAKPKAVRIEIITARYMSDDIPPQWRRPLEQELRARAYDHSRGHWTNRSPHRALRDGRQR